MIYQRRISIIDIPISISTDGIDGYFKATVSSANIVSFDQAWRVIGLFNAIAFVRNNSSANNTRYLPSKFITFIRFRRDNAFVPYNQDPSDLSVNVAGNVGGPVIMQECDCIADSVNLNSGFTELYVPGLTNAIVTGWGAAAVCNVSFSILYEIPK